jgi:DNA-binding FadR family transcriptional regulator
MQPVNSPLIASGYPFADIFSLVNEVGADSAGASVRVVWTLEQAALRRGWPLGEVLGTEGKLLERLRVDRETLREAIRIVEARGSMTMERGRFGGLRIVKPPVADVAAAFAAHLHVRGHNRDALAETDLVAGPVFASLRQNDLIVRLYNGTRDLMTAGQDAQTIPAGRARIIAAQIIRQHDHIPEFGQFLGDESKLCEQLDCSRRVMREALRILNDLAMLRVRRGRAGGYSLIQPSSGAAVRHIFGLLAARHQTLRDIWPAVEALNLIRLRLSLQRLGDLDGQTKSRCHDIIMSVLRERREPERWFALYSRFDLITDNKMISALARGFLAYQARLGLSEANYNDVEHAMKAAEEALVHALWNGDAPAAEHYHREIHAQLSRLLIA